MDRQIVYPGSIPLDSDFLSAQRNALIAFGALARTILGNNPIADGLACTPAGGFSVSIGPGTLSMPLALDGSAYGSLVADGTPTVKTGALSAATTLQLGTTPDQGSVLCWLVQATLQDQDDLPLTLQYWNAANPSVAFSGPNNSGTPQNTRRRTVLVLSTKSSAPVPVGTFAPPSPDPGYVGLYGVTTWVGSTAITQDKIVVLPTAPLLPFHLPDLAPGFSRLNVLSTAQTWVVPQGVERLRVRLVGGGGGGGGGGASYGGGGGGAGGYAEAILSVQGGQSFPAVVGAGGASGTPGVTGGNGAATQFGSVVVASGGLGGASNNPDSHGGTGGQGVAGTLLIAGGLGGDGAMIAGAPAGNGGSSTFGGGGRGSNGGGTPANGVAPGSGAGGGYGANSNGGVGAAGVVLVEY